MYNEISTKRGFRRRNSNEISCAVYNIPEKYHSVNLKEDTDNRSLRSYC